MINSYLQLYGANVKKDVGLEEEIEYDENGDPIEGQDSKI